MHQNVEATAVRIEPRNQPVELVRVEGELTAPLRVWADGAPMEAAEADMALLPGVHAQGAGLFLRGFVEVDVCVVAVVQVFGSLRHGRRCAWVRLGFASVSQFMASHANRSGAFEARG